jgi:hypothetical protein
MQALRIVSHGTLQVSHNGSDATFRGLEINKLSCVFTEDSLLLHGFKELVMRVFTSYESNLYHSLSGLRGGCRNDLIFNSFDVSNSVLPYGSN